MQRETYDGDGNVTATGGKTFSYDSQNELISANGGAVTVMYDGFGNRVSKTANGVTTKYLVEDDVNPTGYPQVFDELTGSALTRTYTYGLQRMRIRQSITSTAANNTTRIWGSTTSAPDTTKLSRNLSGIPLQIFTWALDVRKRSFPWRGRSGH
jgi:YD repeat-containing protein